MLIVSAKFQSARGATHKSAYMASCLTVSDTCFPCLPKRRTLSLSYCEGIEPRKIRVASRESGKIGRVVCWEGEKDVKVVSLEVGKGGRTVSWKGGDGGTIVMRKGWRGWSAVSWQLGKVERGVGGFDACSEEVARWKRCKGSEVTMWEMWESGEVASCEVPRVIQA